MISDLKPLASPSCHPARSGWLRERTVRGVPYVRTRHLVKGGEMGEKVSKPIGWNERDTPQILLDGRSPSRRRSHESPCLTAHSVVQSHVLTLTCPSPPLPLPHSPPALRPQPRPSNPSKNPPPLLHPCLLTPHIRPVQKEIHHLRQTIIIRNQHKNIRVRVNFFQLPNRLHRLSASCAAAFPLGRTATSKNGSVLLRRLWMASNNAPGHGCRLRGFSGLTDGQWEVSRGPQLAAHEDEG